MVYNNNNNNNNNSNNNNVTTTATQQQSNIIRNFGYEDLRQLIPQSSYSIHPEKEEQKIFQENYKKTIY